MKRFLLTTLTFLCALGVMAQENSLLWKVSGNGLKKDSYVFGTIHMACGDDFILKDKLKAAAKATEGLAFEINTTSPENMAKMQNYIKPDPEFFKDFDPKKKAAIDSALISYEMPPTIFDQVSPAAVLSFISLKSFACKDINDIKMMEMEIANLPESQDKNIDELETVEFQFDLINKLFKAEDFYHFLTTGEPLADSGRKLVKAYFSENLKELEELLMNTAYLAPEKQEELVNTRNHAWIKKMPEMMNNKSYLFAVGAGHLIGKQGIIQLLKDKGYQVTPILD